MEMKKKHIIIRPMLKLRIRGTFLENKGAADTCVENVKLLHSQRQYGFAFGCLGTSHPHPAGSAGCLLDLPDRREAWEPATGNYSLYRCSPVDRAA